MIRKRGPLMLHLPYALAFGDSWFEFTPEKNELLLHVKDVQHLTQNSKALNLKSQEPKGCRNSLNF